MTNSIDRYQGNELVSVSQAAKILGLSVSTLYRYEKKGIIRPYRTIGGHRRYKRFELFNFRENVMTSNIPKSDKRGIANE